MDNINKQGIIYISAAAINTTQSQQNNGFIEQGNKLEVSEEYIQTKEFKEW